jgi:hypothetical protein
MKTKNGANVETREAREGTAQTASQTTKQADSQKDWQVCTHTCMHTGNVRRKAKASSNDMRTKLESGASQGSSATHPRCVGVSVGEREE